MVITCAFSISFPRITCVTVVPVGKHSPLTVPGQATGVASLAKILGATAVGGVGGAEGNRVALAAC